MTYIAVPMEKVLDLHIKAMKEQVHWLEADKKDILDKFKSTTSEYPMAVNEKFLILKKQEIISAKGVQVLLDAKKEVLWMVTTFKGLSSEQLQKCSKNLKIRSLINMKFEEIEKVKRFEALAIKTGNNFESRCLSLDEDMTYRLLIGDNKSAMLIWEPRVGEDMVAFWTDSEAFIRVLRIFFEGLWSQSVDMDTRVQQLLKEQASN